MLVKKIYLSLVCYCVVFCSQGQQLVANYHVSKITNIAGKEESLNLKGFQYRKGNKYIYFETPLYLQDFSDEKLKEQVSSGTLRMTVLPKDSIQRIWNTDFDSLQVRFRQPPPSNLNQRFTFDPDYQSWNILSETKEINGLKCQLATSNLPGREDLQWKVWFCSDVPMQSNLYGIIGLPGLVVEAEFIPLRINYKLESYDGVSQIGDIVFWPAEFNEDFHELGHLKKWEEGNNKIQKSKEERRQELLKSQNE